MAEVWYGIAIPHIFSFLCHQIGLVILRQKVFKIGKKSQVSLAPTPTHVSKSVSKSVGWSYFQISNAAEHFCATVVFNVNALWGYPH